MKEKRFRISHVFLFLFLLAACFLFGYMVFSVINLVRYYHWAYIFLALIPLPIFVLCCWAAYGTLKQLIHEIKTGESTSYYADKEN